MTQLPPPLSASSSGAEIGPQRAENRMHGSGYFAAHAPKVLPVVLVYLFFYLVQIRCKQDASTNENMADVEIEPLVLCFYETFEMFRTFSDIFDAELVSRNCVSYIS